MRFFIIISTVVAIYLSAHLVVLSIQFDRNCGGHLKRAADANTVELASQELKVALDYMREARLTTGYTSVIYQTPDEDIGYWHTNLNDSYNELQDLPESATTLEKSNTLMKLRETILDAGEKGDSLTVPKGITRYPNNGKWAFFLLLTWAITVAGWCWGFSRIGY